MALTKETIEGQIDILGEFKHLHLHSAVIVKEDGKEIGRSVNDRTLTPGTLDSSDNFVATDVSSESTDVQVISNQVWTTAVKNAWKDKLRADKSTS